MSNNPPYIITRATENDAKQVAELYRNHFADHVMVAKGLLCNPTYISEQISNESMRWLIATNNDDIVGVAGLAMCRPIGTSEIERVCVRTQNRGNGIAKLLCGSLTTIAQVENMGFVEAFARGSEPAMQQTFANLGFTVYGVAPRFEIMYRGAQVREDFVHMGLVLKPETVSTDRIELIEEARRVKDVIEKKKVD